MLKSSMQPCPSICYSEYKNDDQNYLSRDLQEELNDLKAMLEIHEIIDLEQEEKLKRCIEEKENLKAMLEKREMINLEQEEKLKMCNEEKEKLTTEKNCCVIKISEMEKEIENHISINQSFHKKVAELQEQLNEGRKNLGEECEKVERLTKCNENLSQNLEKKAQIIKNIERQLEDERAFYAEEKARYCKEMKRRKCNSIEVQTDCSAIDDNSPYTLNSDEVIAIMKRLKGLYDYQLIVNYRICEKYIKLRRHQNVLQSRLKLTMHRYKTEMRNIMLRFDECRSYYTALLEDDCNEDNMRKVNQLSRLVSDNAVLKQELLRLNNCLSIMKSKRNLKDDETLYQNEQYSECDEDDDVSSLKKNEIQRKSRSKRKNKIFSDCKKNNYSSSPVISENDSSDYYDDENNSKILAECEVHHSKNNKSESTDSSNELLEESDTSTLRNYSQTNICQSSSSFSSVGSNEQELNENYENAKEIVNSNKIIDEKEVNEGSKMNNIGKDTGIRDDDGPACLQVDQIETNNCEITTSTENTVTNKKDLQEWLAKQPVIECSEWSNSVQGTDAKKTLSSPELLLRSSTF